MEDLYASDVDHVVAVHDGWFVPETVDDGDGAELLEDVIAFFGWEWLSGHTPRLSTPDSYRFNVPPDVTRPGLGAIYDQFVTALAGSPNEDFALDIRARWRERVAAGRWPRFTAS